MPLHCIRPVYDCMVYLMVYEVFLKFNCNSTADGSRVDYLKMSESDLFLQYSSQVAKLKFLTPEKLSENRVGSSHFLLKSNISCTEKVSFYQYLQQFDNSRDGLPVL